MYTLWIERYTQTIHFVTSDLDLAIATAENLERMHTPGVTNIKIYEHGTLVYWIECFAHAATVYHITST